MAKKVSSSPPQNSLYSIVKEKYPDACLNYHIEIPWRKSHRYADIAIPSLKIDIEYDGMRYHRNGFKDRYRDLELLRLGWFTIRVNKHTYFYFAGSLNEIVESIRKRRKLR